jgi:hypothetical protein
VTLAAGVVAREAAIRRALAVVADAVEVLVGGASTGAVVVEGLALGLAAVVVQDIRDRIVVDDDAFTGSMPRHFAGFSWINKFTSIVVDAYFWKGI